MEKLIFDSGIREFQINENGVLRFNPSDPNVYARFMEAAEKIKAVEEDMVRDGKELGSEAGAEVLKLMSNADRDIKCILNDVFGKGNDFDTILGGVNLMAVATNGERVITNLLTALQPILVDGAEACANQQIGDAVQKAEARRAGQK